MKDDRAERRPVFPIDGAGAELVLDIGATIDLRVPQRGGALGRNPARHDLMQAAEDDIGQHVPDGVTRRDGARTLHIQEAALGRARGDRRQGAGVVRNLGRHQAFDAEGGVGQRVVHHDIDAEGAGR